MHSGYVEVITWKMLRSLLGLGKPLKNIAGTDMFRVS